MTRALGFLHRLSIGLWLGAMVGFAALVAPAAFKVLPTRQLAGELVNGVLYPLDLMGLVLGVIALITGIALEGGLPERSSKVRAAALGLMLLCAGTSRFYVSPTLHEIRESFGGKPVDEVPKEDPRRATFGKLHGVSTGLMSLELLAGLVVVFFAPKPRD